MSKRDPMRTGDLLSLQYACQIVSSAIGTMETAYGRAGELERGDYLTPAQPGLAKEYRDRAKTIERSLPEYAMTLRRRLNELFPEDRS